MTDAKTLLLDLLAVIPDGDRATLAAVQALNPKGAAGLPPPPAEILLPPL